MIEQPKDISQELRELIEALRTQRQAIPLKLDLWDTTMIGDYLKVTARTVAERYACRPDFPRPIILPSDTNKKNNRRWMAREVIAWAESLQERRRA